MAFSSAASAAAQLALIAADKPMILGSNRLRGIAAGSLRWNTTGSLATADASATGTLTTYWADGYGHLLSAPSSSTTSWYQCIDLGSLVTFDSIFILGTVLGTTVTIAVADDSAFSTNLTTIATKTPAASDKRVSALVLDHVASTGRVYTAQYLRIRHQRVAGFVPYIGEVFVSLRRQLKENPNEPWDDNSYITLGQDVDTDSGIKTRYVFAEGKRRINADLQPYESTYRTDLSALWATDLAHGRYPFVWIDQPTTSPNNAFFMYLDTPEISYPWISPSEKKLTLAAGEQGPYFRALEV